MHAVALDPTTTLVGWSGSLCELEQGLEVTDPDGARTLALIGYADALCRAAEVTTALVLVWSEPVGDVRVTDDRSAHAFPTAVAGLATQPVSVVLPIRDADDAREVAIKGWLTLDPRSDCGDGAPRPLLDPGCQSYARTGVLSDADGNYVYIINAKNEVERRAIKIGTVDDAGVTIAEGLSGREAIVLSAGPFLNPGQKVKPRRQAAR